MAAMECVSKFNDIVAVAVILSSTIAAVIAAAFVQVHYKRQTAK